MLSTETAFIPYMLKQTLTRMEKLETGKAVKYIGCYILPSRILDFVLTELVRRQLLGSRQVSVTVGT